jgi:DNA-binding transcriptional LysR family regulator
MHDWAEFRHFRYLLTILERGGFRLAAEQLHTSQPNLTVQARQFQESASICLYRKSKDGRIQPTETGLAFIALARLLLETRDETIDALVAIDRGEIESLRLGCSPLVDPEIFRTLRAMHKELLPSCAIRPTHGDVVELIAEILAGEVDAALVTLPVKHPELRVEELRQDKLVVCLRRDSPLAQKAALQVSDLQENLTVLYHPQRHPDAHARLLGLLHHAGLRIEDYSSASHPSEMQLLVKEGQGVALIREGTPLDEQLTTRSILGVDWTVSTAIAFHRQRHPKTIPILARKLRRDLMQATYQPPRRPPQSAPVPAIGSKGAEQGRIAVQLPLLR